MEYNTLVNEIVKRVSEKLNEKEIEQSTPKSKAKILFLSPESGSKCASTFDSSCLKVQCDIDCALSENYNVEPGKYDAVVLFGFSIELLCRLYSGVCETPFSSLAQKAILLDKKIYVPQEDVELFEYCTAKPNTYYTALDNKLKALKGCNITICPCEEIESKILACCQAENSATKPNDAQSSPNLQTVKLTKKVITEKDMSAAKANRAGVVCIAKKAILTDLAKEYAKKYALDIIREDC